MLQLLLASLASMVWSRQCFPDAIQPENRKNIFFDGQMMPIGIWENDWASSLLVSSMFEILTEEKLGFNVSKDRAAASRAVIYMLAGCKNVAGTAEIIEGTCGSTRVNHFSFENWQGYAAYVPGVLKTFEKVPRMAGDLGYKGQEGMFVLERSLQTALNTSGIGLDFYRNWNAQWFNAASWTAKVSDIDLNRLQPCATSVMVAFEEIAEQYVTATGDTAGVKTVNGAVVLDCWQDKWWVAPACRSNPNDCTPCTTAENGWGMFVMIQQASFHNMPVAFATANVEPVNEYVPLGAEHGSLTYWFFPDTAFSLYNPSPVAFPAYNPAEYAVANYRTMSDNTRLTKWAAGGIEGAADKAAHLAETMNLFTPDITTLLKRYVQLGNDPWAASCEWLKSHDTLWQSWMPNETACSSGKGLVDTNGNFITDRGQAVGCETCPVGHYSKEQGATRVCTPCSRGEYQSLPGEDVCLPCDRGKVAGQEGMAACMLCPLGEYAEGTGMSNCSVCGAGTGQEDKWTTSQAVMTHGKETWIQVQGADNRSFCGCVVGTYLWNGLCEDCIEGAICEGSSKLLLAPGYFSRAEEPGAVYHCFGERVRCPGGEPGTCAYGRDTSTVACSACEIGLHARDGICVECGGGDYALVTVVAILLCVCISILYIVLMNEGQKSKQPGSLLIAALGMGQMVTIVQQLTVVQQFKIDWGEPFASILVALEVMAFDLDMISIGCVAPMDPVMKFSTRTLMVLVLFAVASIVHFAYLAWQKSKGGAHANKGFQISLLARTTGTLFTIFFISLCSSLLAPFRCNQHPNGLWTVQAYHGVYCDGEGEHLSMSIVGGLACLLPLGFLALCMWVIIWELPKRLQAADVKFLRACSFLFMRFRPGAEIFSVIFLIRNALVVLCPLLPGASAKVVSMNLILYGSLAMVSFSKPWRAMVCNFLDMMLITGMLVILDMGSLFVEDHDGGTTMVICLIFSALMLLSIVTAVFYGIGKHFVQKYRKPFRFFLCHQKIAAGSMARLLKIELQKRGSRFTTFVDCDDLNDLTRLFSYVGQDTETFVIMGSPDIMTRKWCVGEMCTARSHKVKTVLLMWPDFVKPDKNFIENYDSIVPDITELANYNIGLQEVQDTMAWISTVETIDVPSLVSGDSVDHICSGLTGTMSTRTVGDHRENPDCIIVSDLDNMEAAATAYVLLALIVPKLVGGQRNNMPAVLQKDRSVPSTAVSALVICSDGCFKQFQFGDWLMQVAQLSGCCVLPIIAEDGFRFPSPSYYEEIKGLHQLEMLDLRIYIKAIKAVFQEIAVVFSPQNYSSTQEDLDLRAKQVAWRINSGSLKSLYQKITAKDDDDDDGNANDVDNKAIEDTYSKLVMLSPEQVLEEIF